MNESTYSMVTIRGFKLAVFVDLEVNTKGGVLTINTHPNDSALMSMHLSMTTSDLCALADTAIRAARELQDGQIRKES